MYIYIDLYNPGAVYAALGLFALVEGRHNAVRASFRPDAIELRAEDGDESLARTLVSILRDLAEADLVARDGQIVTLAPRLEDAPPDAPRGVLTAWRGRSLRAWRACQRAIPDALSGGLENVIMAQVTLTDEHGRWVAPPCRDTRLSRWTDIDLGFDRRLAQPQAAPALELLAVIGIEHFPLRHSSGGWGYVTWHHPMSYREARARWLLWRYHGDEQAFEGHSRFWHFQLVPNAGIKGAWGWAREAAA